MTRKNGQPKKTSRRSQDLTPPLKWAGGKRWLLPLLREIFALHPECRLVEPFVGGMAVALGLRPRKALLSDVNPHAVNFYQWLQQGLKIELKLENTAAAYYSARDQFNASIQDGQAESAKTAALFYYLNRTGYNGLCRFNNKGLFNVPFGKYGQINYVKDFSKYRQLLRRWKIKQGDFEEIKLQKQDFVYADPPYDVEFTKYAQVDFTWKDQLRLAEWLAKHQGPVVASNQATKRVIDLYRDLGFLPFIVSAPRMIACTGDRTRAKEMLAVKNVNPMAIDFLSSN